MRSQSTDILGSLTDVLAREHACLLSGKLNELGPLGVEKVELLELLPAVKADAAAIAQVIARAGANQRLATAAASGLRAALRRLGEVERLGDGSGHYDRAGQRMNTAASQRTLRRL